MLIDYKIQQYNVRLLNFDYIFREAFKDYHTKQDAIGFNDDLKTKTAQKFLQNSLIISLCNRIKAIKSQEKVVLYVNTDSTYISSADKDTILTLTDTILRNLPFIYMFNNHNLSTFVAGVQENDMESLIKLEYMKAAIDSADIIGLSLVKMRTFLNREGLNYLANTYFKELSNKIVLIK